MGLVSIFKRCLICLVIRKKNYLKVILSNLIILNFRFFKVRKIVIRNINDNKVFVECVE